MDSLMGRSPTLSHRHIILLRPPLSLVVHTDQIFVGGGGPIGGLRRSEGLEIKPKLVTKCQLLAWLFLLLVKQDRAVATAISASAIGVYFARWVVL